MRSSTASTRCPKLSDNPTSLTADVSGGAYRANKDGARTAEAAYLELIVPMPASLEAQLAARYDRTSDFGSTTNPKLALAWRPLKPVLVRAPSLPELYTAQRPR